MDERVPVVEGVELLLVGGLDPVVQFVADPIAYFRHHHLRVEPGGVRAEQGQSGSDDRGEQVGVGQIGAHRLGRTRILHLDGQLGAVGQPGQVHLADGGRGDRPGREEGEELVGGRSQLGLDDRGDLVGRERRHVILEPGQCRLEQLAGRRRDHAVGVDEGKDLTHLHDCPLHVAQNLGVTLGQPLLADPFRSLERRRRQRDRARGFGLWLAKVCPASPARRTVRPTRPVGSVLGDVGTGSSLGEACSGITGRVTPGRRSRPEPDGAVRLRPPARI